MNIINEQRELTIANNNTGTQQIRDVLENTNKLITSLDFHVPLHGDLDFSVVKELGFGLVREIRIPEGDVTSVVNLPDNLIKFSCIKNLLITLENLPETLEEIDVNANYIGDLKLAHLKNIRIVNVASNKLTDLSMLPPSLVELHCENNHILESIHLGGLKNLKVLHISNTGVHIIHDFPEGVADFDDENTPSIVYRNATELPTQRTNKQDKEDADLRRNKDYVEALNDYFKLKNTYETDLSKARRKLFSKSRSKKTGKLEAQKAKVPCVKCKRPVGTIFQSKDHKYIAICGDTVNPCKLDIQIYTGEFIMYQYFMLDTTEKLEGVKQDIIRQKLNTLFGYLTEEESIAEFKDALSNYNAENELYKIMIDKHDDIFNNETKNGFIEKKNEAIFRLNESVQSLLLEYKTTANPELLQEAVRTQYEQTNAESRNLRMLKHNIMEMDTHISKSVDEKSIISLDKECMIDIKIGTDKDVFIHTLVQHPATLSELEYSLDEPPRVIKFIQ